MPDWIDGLKHGDWRGPAMKGAFRKGALARGARKRRRSPYYTGTVTVGKGRQCVTFGRGMDRAWKEGWDEADWYFKA
jgi:hypothetical protein